MTSRNLPPAGTDKSSPEFATFIAAGMDSSILVKFFEGREEENLFRDRRREEVTGVVGCFQSVSVL